MFQRMNLIFFISLIFFGYLYCNKTKYSDGKQVHSHYDLFENMTLAELQDLRRKTGDDRTNIITEQIQRKLRHIIRLSHGSDVFGYQAGYVYTCREPGGDQRFVCRGDYADDTLHILEFPHSSLHYDPGLEFHFINQYGRKTKKPVKLVFLPDPGLSYSGARILQTDHAFKLKRKGILFAIFRFPEIGFAKYVWVLD